MSAFAPVQEGQSNAQLTHFYRMANSGHRLPACVSSSSMRALEKMSEHVQLSSRLALSQRHFAAITSYHTNNNSCTHPMKVPTNVVPYMTSYLDALRHGQQQLRHAPHQGNVALPSTERMAISSSEKDAHQVAPLPVKPTSYFRPWETKETTENERK